MKVKRYFGADVRQALRQVRQELGPDAVILSNRAIENGVEVVAATDYNAASLEQIAAAARPARSEPPLAIKPDQVTLSGRKPAAAAVNASPAVAAASPRAVGSTGGAPAAGIVWSQDPVLTEMRREIKTLRGLMENHFSVLAWEEYRRRHPLKVDVLQRLQRLGLGAVLAERIVDAVTGTEDIEHCWRAALGILADMVPESDIDLMNHGGLIALVGPTGVGKTTTLAKLAARFALRHGARQVALISTDEFRIGAHEQVRIYGRILNIPVRTVGSADELATALAEFSDRRLVLIDTAGIGQRNSGITGQLQVLEGGLRRLKTYLVMSATTHRTGLLEIVDAFKFINPSACVLTKLDETTQLGGVLGALIESGLPPAYLCDGQRVPEDIHTARKHNLVSRCVAIAQDIDEKYREDAAVPSISEVTSNAGL